MTDTAAFTDLYRRGQQAIAQEDGGAATAAFQALVKLAPALPLARLAAASCAGTDRRLGDCREARRVAARVCARA